MRANWRTELPQLLLIAAMFLATAATWPSAPGRVPMNWGLNGEPDRYGGRFEGLLLLPLIALGLYLLFLYLPRLDPKRANYERFRGAYTIVRVAVLAVLAAIHLFALMWVWGMDPRASAVNMLVGVLFVVIGGVMGKFRPNWFVGIRTPWTLSSGLSWTKTHRLGGWLFVLMGLALIALGFLEPGLTAVAVPALAVGSVVVLYAYSYLVWRGDADKEQSARPTGGE
jgi:uncharacterized membrane protein